MSIKFNDEPLTAERLIEELLGDGRFRAERLIDGFVLVRVVDRNYIVSLCDAGNAQVSFAIGGYTIDTDDLNEWNRTARGCRGYLDERHGAVLTADLLAAAGWSSRMIFDWLQGFDASVGEFHDYVRQANLRHTCRFPRPAVLN